MSEEELAKIEARANAATPAPWDFHKGDLYLNSNTSSGVSDAFLEHVDLNFIAHSRQDVPALIAEVRRLRKLLASAGH
jgi:hypothetical protein